MTVVLYHTMTQSGKNWIKKFLSSKVFLFVIILILIVAAVSVGRESYRKYQLTQEINKLKTEIERLEGSNEQLASLMEYLKEEPYLEKEARLKLNLKKPGEKVVILPKQQAEFQDVSKNIVVSQPEPEKEIANYWEWWEYFFVQ